MSGDESVVLSRNGSRLAEFRFEDRLRVDAATAVAELKDSGLEVQIVSGDREIPVRVIAAELGIPYFAGVLPGGKTAHIAALETSGRKVLMVGDGLNDTPALAAAHASMAPASAVDVGRNAADLVFLRESLSAVPQAISVARERQQARSAKLCPCCRVQCRRGADRNPGPCDAAGRRGGDVRIVHCGRRQRASPQGPAKDRAMQCRGRAIFGRGQ